MTDSMLPSIKFAGDQALLVTFGNSYGSDISRAVAAFDSEAGRSCPDGVIELVPTIRSVLVRYDPARIGFRPLQEWCAALIESRNWYDSPPPLGRTRWRFPAEYGGGAGPDLEEVARLAGVSCERIIELHVSRSLQVLCLGFSPGLAYLAELPEEFNIPRRKAYDSRVPPGSLLVANRQTVLTGTSIPTGWRRIGKTPARIFRPFENDPFLLSPGDSVQFFSMSQEEAHRCQEDSHWKEELIERY